MRPIPTGLLLILIILALLGPGLAFTGWLLANYATAERNRVEQEARDTARYVTTAIDQDLRSFITALQTASTSTRLAAGDFASFLAQLQDVKTFLGADLELRDSEGRLIVSTRGEGGPPPERSREAIASRTPQVSGVYQDPLAGEPYYAVTLPLPKGGEIRLLSALAPTRRIAELARRNLAPGWVIGVGDREGDYVARSDRHEEFSGKPGIPAFLAQARGAQGAFRGRDPDGGEILVGYSRTGLSQWLVAASVAAAQIEGPAQRQLLIFLSLGALALVFSTLVALGLWRQVSRPLGALSAAGAAIARGEAIAPVSSSIIEVRRLSAALTAASTELRDGIRARDAIEARLRANESRLQAIVDTVPVGIVIADNSGRIVWSNRQVEKIIRRPAGREFTAFHPGGEHMARDDHPLTRIIAGATERAELEVLFERGDDTRAWLRLIAAPIEGADGRREGALLAILDIDREKRTQQDLVALAETLEERVNDRTARLNAANASLLSEMRTREAAETQLRQLQKMEAVGQLTGGIAHDFNNMLAVILGGLGLARKRMARGDADIGPLIEAAEDAAGRAAKLTDRLLAFSRQQALSPQPLDCNRLIANLSDLLRQSIGEAIRIETILADGLWRAHADAGQLENAILNLAVNARDAMPEGGLLTIETANAALDEDYAGRHAVAAGQYVMIAVTDTGCGMTPEVMAKAFDPFFTTKGVGKGTGLGLSQVYGFVRQSAGHVQIFSEVGAGACVKLYLPRARGEAADAPAAVAPAIASARGRETVLVVEDDARVQELSVAALQELGYGTLQAGSAAEALKLIESHAEIALLFTDIVMPDMNGRKLADEALLRRPDLKVLFTTGFTRDAVVHDGVVEVGVNILAKPFSLAQLAAKLRSVLD